MRHSFLPAAIACSLLFHVLALNLEWFPAVARAGVVMPWRDALSLRVKLVPALVPAAKMHAAKPSVPPPAAVQRRIPGDPDRETPLVSADRAAPATRPEIAAPVPLPAQTAAPAPETSSDPSAEAGAEAGPPEPTFVEAGGVDEVARPLTEPQFNLPGRGASVVSWKIEFDLLIDSEGKAVRVDNVVANAPGEVVGAVLAAFYVLRFEPAKLAGQPIAIRQRFEVHP
jgi:hypothetical protein